MRYNIPLPRLLDGATMRETRRISATDASCALNITPLSTYTIQAPYFEEIPERSWVEGFGPNGSLGIYRLRSPGRHFGKDNRTFSFEHGIVEIGDYILNGELKTTGTAGTILSQIFSHYRGSLWQLGSIATTPEIRFDNGYCDLMTAVNEVMGQLPDYMLTFDQTSLPWKMNLVAKPSTVRAEGRLTRNILSARITYDDSELCTRLYNPVSTGGYMDADTISRYGVVEGWAAKDDSDQSDAAFLAECSRYLRQHKEPLISVTMEMLDLQAITGEELDGVDIGDLFRLALVDYNLTHEQTVVSINYPSLYGSPGRATVTLGNEEMTMSRSYSSSEAAQARTNYRQGGINNSFAGAIAGNTQALTIQSDEIAIIGGQARQNRIDINDQGIRLSSTENTLVGTTQRLEQAEINITSQGVSIGALRDDYNTVSGKQTTMEAQITVMAGEISSKVSKTDYDELENVVSRHSTEISQNADQIALKVSQGDVATQLAVEMGNVSISNGNLIVDGYVTSSGLQTAIAQIQNTYAQQITTNTFACVTGSARDFTVYGTFNYKGGEETDPVSVLSAICDIGTAQESDGHFTIPTTTVGGSAGPNINFNIAASQTYIDGVAAARRSGRADMGVEADSENGAVKVVQGSTKSLTITVTEPVFTYNASGHYYRATASAKAGNTVMHTATSLTHSGTQAYTDGVTAGEAKFSLVDVTLQGASESVYVPDSNGAYYLRGTAVTRYTAGEDKTYYLRHTTALKLKHDGTKTYYVAPTSGATGYKRDWYYVDSGGTNYYTSNGSTNVTLLGTGGTYYQGDGTRLGTATRYKAGTRYNKTKYYEKTT